MGALFFLNYFSDLPDLRQLIKVVYPLDEVLLLSFISGAGWGCDFPRHRPFRRKQARSAAQVPTVTQQDADPRPTGLGLAALDPERFQQCFVAWAAASTGISAEVIAIDGKTSRRSFKKKGEDTPIGVGMVQHPMLRILTGNRCNANAATMQ